MPITISDGVDNRSGSVGLSLAGFSQSITGTFAAAPARDGFVRPTLSTLAFDFDGQFASPANTDGRMQPTIGGFGMVIQNVSAVSQTDTSTIYMLYGQSQSINLNNYFNGAGSYEVFGGRMPAGLQLVGTQITGTPTALEEENVSLLADDGVRADIDWASRSSGAVYARNFNSSESWDNTFSPAGQLDRITVGQVSGTGCHRHTVRRSDEQSGGLWRAELAGETEPFNFQEGETGEISFAFFPSKTWLRQSWRATPGTEPTSLKIGNISEFGATATPNEIVSAFFNGSGVPTGYFSTDFFMFFQGSNSRFTVSQDGETTTGFGGESQDFRWQPWLIDTGAPPATDYVTEQNRFGAMRSWTRINGQNNPPGSHPSREAIAPNGPSWHLIANTWHWFRYRLEIGTWGVANSRIRVWGARRGQSWQLIADLENAIFEDPNPNETGMNGLWLDLQATNRNDQGARVISNKHAMPGVEIVTCGSGVLNGDAGQLPTHGTLTYTAATQELQWQATGDTAGAAVDVSAGGEFPVVSGTNASADRRHLQVDVTVSSLPSVDTSIEVKCADGREDAPGLFDEVIVSEGTATLDAPA